MAFFARSTRPLSALQGRRNCSTISAASAIEQGGFILAWIGLVDRNDGKVSLVASHGATGYLDGIQISANQEPVGEGPTGIAIRLGTHFICNDFQNNPCTAPWHERGRMYGIKASASVALIEQGRVIGTLTVYANEENFFDQPQVELLAQMGADISFALDNMVREKQRQQAEQALMQETLERLRTVEALREKEQMLLHQNRLAAMGEMIHNIAHQWRQPLTTLSLLLQQMQLYYQTGNFDSNYFDASVDKATELIRHMSRTIDDFRNFFRPEKELIRFSVKEVVANAVSLVENAFLHHQITIELQTGSNPLLNGFPGEYAHVLLNILTNARDALLEKRSCNRKIVICIDSAGEKSVVTIADNAGGIPQEIQEKIFEPYFSTKGPASGTGVGLFMSKTIIEKNMHGSLTVSNSDEGALFRIEV